MRNRIAGILCLGSLISVAQVQQPQVQQPQQTYSHEPLGTAEYGKWLKAS
jgi:hypothetical protein